VRLAAIAVLSIGFAALFGMAGLAGGQSDGGNCVLYARDATGIDLQGNAGAWWALAEGRYARGHEPEKGAILVFKPSRFMPSGHVAVVSQVISDREIQVDQANWIRGRIVKNLWVLDASPNNDWTLVEVENLGSRTYGRDNPTFGFVYPQPPQPRLDEIAVATEDARHSHPQFAPIRFAVAMEDPDPQREPRPGPQAMVKTALFIVEKEPTKKSARSSSAKPRAHAHKKTHVASHAAKHEASERAAAKHPAAKHVHAKHEVTRHAAATRASTRHKATRHAAAAHHVVKTADKHDIPRRKRPAVSVRTILASHKVREPLD
jgi:CHAP domain